MFKLFTFTVVTNLALNKKNVWSRFACILFKLHEIWKITNIVATRCHILNLKCYVGCGSALTPLEELTALLKTP